MRAVVLALAVASAVGSDGETVPTWEIRDESTVYQMGMYPYLLGGGAANVVASEEACKQQCLGMSECQYGTFVSQGNDGLEEATHAYSTLVRYGECWLSSSTHATQVECGVECSSFSKQPYQPPTTTAAAAPASTTTTIEPEYDHNLTYEHKPCLCDPVKHPSRFTTCHQDPFSYHVIVHHLDPRFHTLAYKGGEQHKCKMYAVQNGTKTVHSCKCCDCRDDGSTFDIREIGFGIHTAKAPFLLGGGTNNIVEAYENCTQLCHDTPRCRAGTYIAAGTAAGQCWLSENVEPQQPCEKPCHSFVKLHKLGEKGYQPAPEKLPLDECHGHCGSNDHCPTGYVCHPADGGKVPGCEGYALDGVDYCIREADAAWTPAYAGSPGAPASSPVADMMPSGDVIEFNGDAEARVTGGENGWHTCVCADGSTYECKSKHGDGAQCCSRSKPAICGESADGKTALHDSGDVWSIGNEEGINALRETGGENGWHTCTCADGSTYECKSKHGDGAQCCTRSMPALCGEGNVPEDSAGRRLFQS